MTKRQPLWHSAELTQGLGDILRAPIDAGLTVNGVQIDSRGLAAGDLFIALSGAKQDGHDFVEAALAAGACALVRADTVFANAPEARLIRVSDTARALTALAAYARARMGGRVVAITGSVGKTSVKNWLAQALAASGRVHAAEKSYNNHVGVPLSLARLPRDADYAVFEIGMNHAGEIAPLAQLARPHIALVTAVGAAHLAHFADEAAIAHAKAEIFSGLEKDGLAIIPADNPHTPILRATAEQYAARIYDFSTDDKSDATALAVKGSGMTASVIAHKIDVQLGAVGAHHISNALCVLLTVSLLGADIGKAATALAQAEAAEGRGACYVLSHADGCLMLVDESYNANPLSMRAALAALAARAPIADGRRIAVLGDMAELGRQGEDFHAALADAIIGQGIARVFTVGPLMRALHDALPAPPATRHVDAADAVVAPLIAEIVAGDVVMVKGSNSSNMARVTRALLEEFPPKGEPHVL